ncbi:hypothetical protein GGH94_006260 [Coemansia aciculifera]|uniref:Uncharacterized protein n=1 Tax=Coemansia aciculifera TaxID=417176 RepID=A0A9W8IKU0_9FUNG|nr:hypothetical protein GGH94_006260 [Coemansia aciculifera]
MEVKLQTSRTQPRSTVDVEFSTVDVEANESVYSSDNEGDDIAEVLSKDRLDDIYRDASTTKPSWTNPHSQYPRKQSGFAPLSITDSGRESLAIVGVTELDADLSVDETYNQVATMPAYGMGLLRIVLSGRHVSKKRVRQASDVLSALCATPINTRGWHKAVLSRVISEKVESFKRTRSLSKKPDRSVEQSCSVTTKQGNSMMDIGVSSPTPHITGSRQACISVEDPLVASPIAVALGSHNAAVEEFDQASSRRNAIQNTLLRKGWQEQTIAAYFDQFSRNTNCHI